MKAIGILGGTFDPIHNGHLEIAQAAYDALDLAKIIFIPNKTPPHRKPPEASADDRLAMIETAIAPYAYFEVNDIELQRPSPSYTIDTIIALKKQNPDAQYQLILGEDAFATLPQWHQWQTLRDYIHFVVIPRRASKEATLSPELKTLPKSTVTWLDYHPADITASRLRKQLHQQSVNPVDLPPSVLKYIQAHQLYGLSQ